MDGYDLAARISDYTWTCLQCCVNEAMEVETDAEFVERTGVTLAVADSLWDYLDQGHDRHPLLSREQLLLAADCADIARELVDDWEFRLRLNFDKPDAVALAAELRSLASD